MKKFASSAMGYMFPISELSSAYGVIRSTLFDDSDVNRKLLHDMMEHLLFVTIGFLTREQERKNMLVRMDVMTSDDDDGDDDDGDDGGDDDDDGGGGGGGDGGDGDGVVGSEDDGTKGGGGRRAMMAEGG